MLDKSGRYHMNAQRARAADRMGEKPKPSGFAKPGASVSGDETGTKTHTVEEHPDGHFETHMHDGTHAEHPDHLHMMAHIGHHVSGGDKHHIAHHDGMSMRTHGVHESGEHQETQEHASPEDAKEAMGQFFNEGNEGGNEAESGSGEPQIAAGY